MYATAVYFFVAGNVFRFLVEEIKRENETGKLSFLESACLFLLSLFWPFCAPSVIFAYFFG